MIENVSVLVYTGYLEHLSVLYPLGRWAGETRQVLTRAREYFLRSTENSLVNNQL